jgi:hypothetical protein
VRAREVVVHEVQRDSGHVVVQAEYELRPSRRSRLGAATCAE